MFKASSLLLLLLSLILNVQLQSSAPISARIVQSTVVAEEPGPKELAPVEEEESVQGKVIQVIAGEEAPSPGESPAEGDIAVIVKESEPIPVKDLVSDDAGKAISLESDPQEPLTAASQESSEDEIVPVEAAFAELSPEVEVSPAAAVESGSPDQQDVQDQDLPAPIPIRIKGALEDKALEENLEEEASPKETLLIMPEEHAAAEPDSSQEPLPSAPEEEKSIVLVPAEWETKEEPAAEETAPEQLAPEEPGVIIPVESAVEDPEGQEEMIKTISTETTKEEAQEEHAKEEEEAALPIADPATNEEHEEVSIVLLPVEPEIKGEDQVEPTAEKTATIELAPIVIFPVDSSEGEVEQKEEVTDKVIPIVSPEASEEETALTVASEEDPRTNKVHLPSAPEEKEPIVLGPAGLRREEGLEEIAPQESAPGEPFAVLVESTSEGSDAIFVIPLVDPAEEAPEDNTEDEEVIVQSDPFPGEPALEEDTVSQENEPDDNDPEEIPVISVTETPSESETIETVLDQVKQVSVATTQTLTEDEHVPASSPAVTDAGAETVSALVGGGGGTGNTTHIEDFIAAIIRVEDDPVALMNRGLVLGAAFFTLMSFIAIGFVWTTISKKLR